MSRFIEGERGAAGSSMQFEALEGRAMLSTTGAVAPLGATVVSSAIVSPMTLVTTTTGLVQSTANTTYGQSVTLTATVKRASGTGAVPTGVVTFKSNGVAVGTGTLNTSGVATLATTKLAVGTDNLTASYGGSATYAGGTSGTAAHYVVASASKTVVASSALTAVLGQPVTFTATVSAVAPGAGVPTGSVRFYDGATVLATTSLSNGRATYTVPNFFTGTHTITATFLGTAQYKLSKSAAIAQVVNQGAMTTLADGLKVSTTVAGSGPGAVSGQAIRVNYTGYLTNGTKFDSSLNAGRTPFDFTLGTGQVIKGWDEGMVGARVGEQRVLIIPPALGYGSTAQGSIPANSTLIFIVKVVSFLTNPSIAVKGGSGLTVAVTNNEAPTTTNGTSFGGIKVGASSTTMQFAISNVGNAPLSFTGNPWVQVSGTNAADFVVGQPVISGNQAIFTVTFKPKALGARSARITIPTNDPKFPSFGFNVIGTGT